MTTDDFIASFKYSVLQHAYKNKNISDNPVITEMYLREVEKKKETHIQAFYPGYLPRLVHM